MKMNKAALAARIKQFDRKLKDAHYMESSYVRQKKVRDSKEYVDYRSRVD